jgi:CDP-6-deoxy-D-xylo-4-hexulose-3-dehydrase
MNIIRYGGAVTGIREVWAILKSVVKSTFTRQWQAGKEAKLLEQELSDYVGTDHTILTTSGSCAGLLALHALELPRGSEVIIPAVTFPTIFNIILQCDLVPVVVDVEVGTYNLDPLKLEEAISDKTKAIIAVHAVGNPAKMKEICEIADKHGLYVIEDNCDGLGTDIGNRKAGNLSDISFTSLHAAHIVSMGVGGAVFTNNDTLAKNVRI